MLRFILLVVNWWVTVTVSWPLLFIDLLTHILLAFMALDVCGHGQIPEFHLQACPDMCDLSMCILHVLCHALCIHLFLVVVFERGMRLLALRIEHLYWCRALILLPLDVSSH